MTCTCVYVCVSVCKLTSVMCVFLLFFFRHKCNLYPRGMVGGGGGGVGGLGGIEEFVNVGNKR